MQCIITSPTKTDEYQNIISVTLPTHNGIVQFKPGHAEYFANIVSGNVVCVTQSQKIMSIEVQKGICRVVDDTVTIIV